MFIILHYIGLEFVVYYVIPFDIINIINLLTHVSTMGVLSAKHCATMAVAACQAPTAMDYALCFSS